MLNEDFNTQSHKYIQMFDECKFCKSTDRGLKNNFDLSVKKDVTIF